MKPYLLSRRDVLIASLASLTGCSPAIRKSQPVVTKSPPLTTPSLISFNNVTHSAGINYKWQINAPRPLNILGTIGNGCAFLDYDRDGNLDILLVSDRLALYKGDGRGNFRDVSEETGLSKLKGHFLGCAVGDYDNDGFPDIYLTAYQGGALLHNEGGKHFTDVSRQATIPAQPWGTSAAWVQLTPESGLLDLVIGNYVSFGPQTSPQLCPNGNHMTSCGPRYYTAHHPKLYKNLGGGRFLDVSAQWKMTTSHGKNLGIACADYDHSGRQSISFANDEVEGDLMSNTGSSFKNVAAFAGTAFDHDGARHGGMGTDWGDYDNDGKLDLVVATFQNETKCIYHNDGGGNFSEVAERLGLAAIALPYVSFGAKWLDVDNDGWLDLIIASGHVQDNIHEIDPASHYREPTLLLHNKHGQLFEDISSSSGSAFGVPIVGRGLAIGDYDNDGRMDALVVNSEGAPLLLHNESKTSNNWIILNLEGVQSNRQGYGALVTLDTGTQKLLRVCHADGSYMSSSDPRVHCGLGTASTATISVKWPSGKSNSYGNLNANHQYTLREGDSTPHVV